MYKYLNDISNEVNKMWVSGGKSLPDYPIARANLYSKINRLVDVYEQSNEDVPINFIAGLKKRVLDARSLHDLKDIENDIKWEYNFLWTLSEDDIESSKARSQYLI